MPCMIVNAQIFALVLFLSDDFLAVFMPFMAVMVDGTQYFGNWGEILNYLPWAIPPVIAVIFHFAVYRKPIRFGMSGRGICAVSLAVLLSGFSVVSLSDMADVEAIYHYAMFSLGAFLLYVIFYSNLSTKKRHDIYEHFIWCLFYVGFACFVIVFDCLTDFLLSENADRMDSYFELIYARNSVAPLLIMALPAPFYFAKKKGRAYTRIFAFLIGLMFYAALLLTGARTAFLFGTLFFVICLFYFCYGKEGFWVKLICMGIFAAAAWIAWRRFGASIVDLIEYRLTDGRLVSPDEARVKLLFRSVEDLYRAPLFGIGIASTANVDLYGEMPGCIVWYHLYFPQIWGSMGFVGLVAYLYQGIVRLRLSLYRPIVKTAAIALSYLGLFFYSQTDPGEFVPIPFGIMAILMFALLDHHYEANSLPTAPERRDWLLFPWK